MIVVLGYFVWSAGWAVLAWFIMADNQTSRWVPVGYAVISIVGAFLFWVITTNWRGWAKGFRVRSLSGQPGRSIHPQSRPMKIAASIAALLVVLSDLLVIGLVLIR
ncbi:hypothetical protein [Nitrolancea hollandica]|uniref:hypothetical protein n=1 Tax=Nitrolancea hollandica TaxID=1206749 RepID=UPI00058DEE73|nr:hypothetical protein [Nitrolancea hollandica]